MLTWFHELTRLYYRLKGVPSDLLMTPGEMCDYVETFLKEADNNTVEQVALRLRGLLNYPANSPKLKNKENTEEVAASKLMAIYFRSKALTGPEAAKTISLIDDLVKHGRPSIGSNHTHPPQTN